MAIPGFEPGMITSIHEIDGTLETLKTWMAGTTPDHDANGDGLAGRVPVVEATRKRRKSATFPRPRQRSNGQPWDTPGDDARSDGLVDRVSVVSATRNRKKSAPFPHGHQRLTGLQWA
jgi:hypothetical protein